MMQTADFIAAGITLSVNDQSAALRANAAVDWINENTTLAVEDADTLNKLPASAKLFVCKFVEAMGSRTGVQSQSIEGLSMTFASADKSTLIWQLAHTLLGGYMKSQVQFFPAKRRW